MTACGRFCRCPRCPRSRSPGWTFWSDVFINEANNAGGEDNITAVLLEVEACDVAGVADPAGKNRASGKTKRLGVYPHGASPGAELTKTLHYTQREEVQ